MATDRIIEHIDRLREKPEHVRHQIALATAAGITGIVAVTWAAALATSGTLALKPVEVPEDQATVEVKEAFAQSSSAFSQLMGAAGAAFSGSTEDDLTVVETRTSSTLETKSEPANNTDKTVIPF